MRYEAYTLSLCSSINLLICSYCDNQLIVSVNFQVKLPQSHWISQVYQEYNDEVNPDWR